ncbi:MAG: endonuclease/exonuclease/phosphatase family protein [Xanthomonadaceae bacterium]|nr:endonuclease/exonuclease/phosphatase family protein [Xanthomonadaceae bacterium]
MKHLLTLMLGLMSLQGFAGETHFKVVSYNVNFFTKPEIIAQDIQSNENLKNADVILLQEITREASQNWDPLTQVAAQLGMQATFIPGTRFRGQDYGNGILSRTPLTSIEMITLPHSKAENRDNIRSAVIADTLLPNGETITIATVHLSVFFCDKSLAAQLRGEQLEVLLKRLKERGAKNVIFGGDLNTSTPWSWTKLQEKTKSYSYTLSHPHKGWTMKYLHLKLDHLFHQGNLSVLSHGIGKGSRGSDHLPIWVDYSTSVQ